MSEPVENPFKSPVTDPIYRSQAGSVRRAAGAGAYVVALYDALIFTASVVGLTFKLSTGYFTAVDGYGVGGIIFGCSFAAGSFWSGRRLRSRSHGTVEWVVFVAVAILSIAGVYVDL
jgi:hypothetical protein